jgi:hypothetical protein
MRLDDSIGLTMARKKAPELNFQTHIADYLVREHKYGVLEQTDITDRGGHRQKVGRPTEVP